MATQNENSKTSEGDVAEYSSNEKAIAEYSRLTQEEFRSRVLSPEFAASVDAAIPGSPVPVVREPAKSAGPVICPHGEVEVYCSECDLKARAELHDAVALAVMAERERCANIASVIRVCGDMEEDQEAAIAAAVVRIRSGYSGSPPLRKYMREVGERMDEAARSDGKV